MTYRDVEIIFVDAELVIGFLLPQPTGFHLAVLLVLQPSRNVELTLKVGSNDNVVKVQQRPQEAG